MPSAVQQRTVDGKMRTHPKLSVRVAGALLLAIASLLPFQAANAQAMCPFQLGFASLHDQIPAIVGDCTENVQYDTDGHSKLC